MVNEMRRTQTGALPQPWDLTHDGHLRLEGPLATAEFRVEGLALQGSGTDRVVAWKSINSLCLAMPVHRLWSRSLLVGLSVFGDGYVAEPRNMWIYYTDDKERRIDLGRPENAPFSKSTFSSTDEVLTVLSEMNRATGTNRLRLLGDPGFGPAIIAAASTSYRRWDYFSIKSTRSVIERIAPNSAHSG